MPPHDQPDLTPSADQPTTTEMVAQSLQLLHAKEETTKLALPQMVARLKAQDDAAAVLVALAKDVPSDDVSLHWSLVYLMGSIKNLGATKYLADLIAMPLLPYEPDQGCEQPGDFDLLVRTMAIEALKQIAQVHLEVAGLLLTLLGKPLARPILIALTRAASDLGLTHQAAAQLRPDHQWMLTIRQARSDELTVGPEEIGPAAPTTPRPPTLSSEPPPTLPDELSERHFGPCGARIPNLETSGDTLYAQRACSLEFRDWAWDAFDFDDGDWDNGFGYGTHCDETLPLARTYAAIWCLTYSAPQFDEGGAYNPDKILQWGSRYAREKIDELDARCGDGTAIARTRWALVTDNWTQLYRGFFYTEGVSLRAGTLIHEARHASHVGHDRGNNDSTWGRDGAWRWHVVWLAQFYYSGSHTSLAMRLLAQQRANNIIDTRFETHPGFHI